MERMFVSFLVLSLVAHGYAAVVSSNSCPPKERIRPCTCRESSEGVVTECKELTVHGDLEDIFKRVPGWGFTVLYLIDSSMLYFPSSTFTHSDIRDIKISGSTFVSLFEKPPVSNSLKGVYVSNSVFLRGIQWNLFSSLNLESLTFFQTRIRKLPKSFGKEIPKSLKLFQIIHSNINRISEDSFVKLPNLEAINICFGALKRLDGLKFPKSIKTINFSNNRIETLPDGFFNDLPNLFYVILENNEFTTIKKEVFSGIRSLYMEGNPIDCNCRVKWLSSLRSSDCSSFLNAKCDSPHDLNGKELCELGPSHFSYCGNHV